MPCINYAIRLRVQVQQYCDLVGLLSHCRGRTSHVFHRFGLDAARLQASYYCVLLLVDHLFSALFIIVLFYIAQNISSITRKTHQERHDSSETILSDTCDDGPMPCLAVVFAVFLPSRGLHLYAHVFGVIDGLGCKGTCINTVFYYSTSTKCYIDNHLFYTLEAIYLLVYRHRGNRCSRKIVNHGTAQVNWGIAD